MKNIRVILWDFDGTLLDSTKESMENMIQMANELKLRAPTIEMLQKYWGIPWLEFIEKIAKACDWKEGSTKLFINKCKENKELWRKHQLFSKTKETLESLVSQGIKIGIISTRIKESAGKDLFSIMDYFRILDINPNIFFVIQGRENCRYIKPNPMVFNLVLTNLKKENIDLDQIVYVGDTIHDFKAASNYVPSLSFVAITSGACSRSNFLEKEVPSECVISSPKEIFGAIEFLNSEKVVQ